ncbi:MAG: hypothetical protein IH623_29620 [Verrucomicrobia bacterium]|nr:hypothetical protein [Verrucomicrobiota bacterium]
MKTLDRQKLDVVNKTRSNLESFRGWRGQFTPELQVLNPSNARGFETGFTEP